MQRIIATLVVFIALFTMFDTSVLAASVGDLDSGAAVFKTHCAGCHVNGGNIVRRGKNLKMKALHRNKADTQDAIAYIVTNGKGIMSAYRDKLTPEQIADVSAYVLQRAETGWKR